MDDDGWFQMGDVGYFDDEGNVYVIDRVKEVLKCNRTYVSKNSSYSRFLLKSNGLGNMTFFSQPTLAQVIPSEIENIIQTHPSVSMVGVVGAKDPETGEDIPVAYVTLKDDKTFGCDILKYANGK